jgi:hypothetical protein
MFNNHNKLQKRNNVSSSYLERLAIIFAKHPGDSSIFSFSTKGTVHAFFMMEIKDMQKPDTSRYVEVRLRPLRNQYRSEIILSYFSKGHNIEGMLVKPIFDGYSNELKSLMAEWDKSGTESLPLKFATTLFSLNFDITKYSSSKFLSDEDGKPLFNPYISSVPRCLWVTPCHQVMRYLHVTLFKKKYQKKRKPNLELKNNDYK